MYIFQIVVLEKMLESPMDSKEINPVESVLMRWMKLEPVIQSEVSQKDKDH